MCLEKLITMGNTIYGQGENNGVLTHDICNLTMINHGEIQKEIQENIDTGHPPQEIICEHFPLFSVL